MLLSEFTERYQKNNLADKAFVMLTDLEGLNRGDMLVLRNKTKKYYLNSIGNNYLIIKNEKGEIIKDFGICILSEAIDKLSRFVQQHKIKEISLH